MTVLVPTPRRTITKLNALFASTCQRKHISNIPDFTSTSPNLPYASTCTRTQFLKSAICQYIASQHARQHTAKLANDEQSASLANTNRNKTTPRTPTPVSMAQYCQYLYSTTTKHQHLQPLCLHDENTIISQYSHR